MFVCEARPPRDVINSVIFPCLCIDCRSLFAAVSLTERNRSFPINIEVYLCYYPFAVERGGDIQYTYNINLHYIKFYIFRQHNLFKNEFLLSQKSNCILLFFL